MRASVSMAQDDFARLRRRIAEIEGRPGARDQAVAERQSPPASLAGEGWGGECRSTARALAPRRGVDILPFALPRLDRMLAGGLRRDALHELWSDTAREAAATGFAAAILARLTAIDDRPVLWIVEAASAREAGLPYGAGLDRFGADSTRLIVVRVRKPGDALWVSEEGLSCRGLAAVLTEIRGNPRVLDLTASAVWRCAPAPAA